MALIQHDRHGYEKHDLVLVIQSREQHKKFEFKVERNRVDVRCLNPDKKARKNGEPNFDDWRAALSDEEKVRVFALILDEYRKHSIGDEHGYRGAVLGVATNGDIFLGANTAMDQITSPYLKECAEQNMVSAASDLVAYKQVKLKGWDNFDRPKAPKFESLYMMGGVSQMQVPVSCPCGKCTDMLAKNMAEGAKVFALPILNQATFDYLNSTKKQTSAVEISLNQSETLEQVRESVTRKKEDSAPLNPYPVWQTTIGHLNAERKIDLKKEHVTLPIKNTKTNKAENKTISCAELQSMAYTKLCREAKDMTGLREEKLAAEHQEATKTSRIKSSLQFFEAMLSDLFAGTKKLSNKAAGILGLSKTHPVAMAAANQFVGRRSIAELDAASLGSLANLAAINQFMLSEIRHTLADRILFDPKARNIWVEGIGKAVPNIRCVVIQLDDGTFHHAVECSGKYDASLPNAEAAAVVQALPSLGRCNISDVWVMEMNSAAKKEGVLMTSPKEGAERIIKRGAKDLKFHYIPLNTGELSVKELESIIKNRPAAEVMPALFKGSRPLESKEINHHRPWSEFLSMQAANAEALIQRT